MSDKIRVLLPEEEVEERIRQIGKQITEDYANEEVFLICTLKGASFFACELAKRIDLPLTLDFIAVASYGSGTQSSGEVRMIKDLDQSIEGKNVLVIEDIVDTGRTLSYLLEIMNEGMNVNGYLV